MARPADAGVETYWGRVSFEPFYRCVDRKRWISHSRIEKRISSGPSRDDIHLSRRRAKNIVHAAIVLQGVELPDSVAHGLREFVNLFRREARRAETVIDLLVG